MVRCNQLSSLQTEGISYNITFLFIINTTRKCQSEIKIIVILQVSVLLNLFNESRSDQQSKEVLGEITDYNKRYSGAPRTVSGP